MKTLSIKQPWGSLVVSGVKDIENRTWRTTHRGRIYVHASGMPVKIPPVLLLTDGQILASNEFWFGGLQNGAIIGEVDIVDCVLRHDSIWAEHAAAGDKPIWNWILANPVKYDQPILNVKGKLSLWEYEKEVMV